jgi:DNA-binding transcriptional regulator YiaG
MDTDWKTLRAELPDEVRARLDAKRNERRLGKALAAVRKATQATQQEVAARAGMTQNTVSKLERADDVLASSVVRYMRSIGGGVELVLKTPDGKESRVDLTPEPNCAYPPRPRHATRPPHNIHTRRDTRPCPLPSTPTSPPPSALSSPNSTNPRISSRPGTPIWSLSRPAGSWW